MAKKLLFPVKQKTLKYCKYPDLIRFLNHLQSDFRDKIKKALDLDNTMFHKCSTEIKFTL